MRLLYDKISHVSCSSRTSTTSQSRSHSTECTGCTRFGHSPCVPAPGRRSRSHSNKCIGCTRFGSSPCPSPRPPLPYSTRRRRRGIRGGYTRSHSAFSLWSRSVAPPLVPSNSPDQCSETKCEGADRAVLPLHSRRGNPAREGVPVCTAAPGQRNKLISPIVEWRSVVSSVLSALSLLLDCDMTNTCCWAVAECVSGVRVFFLLLLCRPGERKVPRCFLRKRPRPRSNFKIRPQKACNYPN